MSFYDDNNEKNLIEDKTKKKSSTRKRKTPVKRKRVEKVVVQKESPEKKLSKIKRKKNEDNWDFIVRVSIETGLPGKVVAEYFEKQSEVKPEPSDFAKKALRRITEAANRESKRHLDDGRSVYDRIDNRPVEIIPNPDSTNTIKNFLDEPKKPTITPEQFLQSVQPKPEYIKHLIKCRCVLPQFQKMEEPPDHQFIVFSELQENGLIKPHYAQCNNCGLIHKIHEVGISETLKKETMLSLPSINDLKNDLPEWAVALLNEHNCDLHTWQELQFILKHKLWGRFIILAKDRDDNTVIKKVCQVLGEKLFKVEAVEEEEGWIEP